MPSQLIDTKTFKNIEQYFLKLSQELDENANYYDEAMRSRLKIYQHQKIWNLELLNF